MVVIVGRSGWVGWRQRSSGGRRNEEASRCPLGGVGVAEESAGAFLIVWEV